VLAELDMAMEMERIALTDNDFFSRKLCPKLAFDPGIILKASQQAMMRRSPSAAEPRRGYACTRLECGEHYARAHTPSVDYWRWHVGYRLCPSSNAGGYRG
jgi:hypothetical protein